MRALPPPELASNSTLEERGPPRTTGRTLVLLREGADATAASARALHNVAGLRMRDSGPTDRDASVAAIPPSGAVLLDRVGVAVVNGDPDQIGRLCVQVARSDVLLAVEPERVVHSASADCSRDVEHGISPLSAAELPQEVAALGSSTWGLRACGVLKSCRTGAGVRLAVLSTGINLAHADFAARPVVERSFVAGESPHDVLGHGTLASAIACGTSQPPGSPRYAVAGECEVFAGKVLSDRGMGTDGGLLAGIAWALEQDCQIVLLPLSTAVARGAGPSLALEIVSRRALAAGALLVAAAGDYSDRSSRPAVFAPVAHPGNCHSIMAVAAMGRWGEVARHSNRVVARGRSWIDIAAPDFDPAWTEVASRGNGAPRDATLSSTGAAAAHLAGLAALHAEALPGITPLDLWTRLLKSALPLDLPAKDVGAGLAQAPG